MKITQLDPTTKVHLWQKWVARIFELVKIVVILTMLGYLVHVFIVTLFVVDGASMEPNFFDKEYLLVNKIAYDLDSPKRGDVIIFSYPGEPEKKFIKRIVGIPGDTVEIKDGKVFVSNKYFQGELKERYIPKEMPTPTETLKATITNNVGKDEYFVLGDNRLNSSDSRIWGLLPKENIIGKAIITIWPMNSATILKDQRYSF